VASTALKVLALAIGAVVLGSAAYYAGEQAGMSGVDSTISSELKATTQGTGLLGAEPNYTSYIDSLAAGCNAALPNLQNMSNQLKAYNDMLKQYASLPYNATVAAEIQTITSQSQTLQLQIQLTMTQMSQCWSVVSSILQSLNQTFQRVNGTVNGR
jgi:Effector from type III secretion system